MNFRSPNVSSRSNKKCKGKRRQVGVLTCYLGKAEKTQEINPLYLMSLSPQQPKTLRATTSSLRMCYLPKTITKETSLRLHLSTSLRQLRHAPKWLRTTSWKILFLTCQDFLKMLGLLTLRITRGSLSYIRQLIKTTSKRLRHFWTRSGWIASHTMCNTG